jgi:hypothetical protein
MLPLDIYKNRAIVFCMDASILENKISVRHSIRPDVGREFITFDIPNGWDDVKKICKKVLLYDGKEFIFSAWNSDRNECFFYRMLDGSTKTAEIKRK